MVCAGLLASTIMLTQNKYVDFSESTMTLYLLRGLRLEYPPYILVVVRNLYASMFSCFRPDHKTSLSMHTL